MKTRLSVLLFCLFLNFTSNLNGTPIRLHPDNPHYFLYKDRPTILIASGEHYGAVINMDFDFATYLNTLEEIGLNHTRIFLGDYIEEPGAFCIETNTLSPKDGRFICPWKRSNVDGFSRGGNKFNLDQWDPAYFKRLHDFMSLAEKKGVIVEAVLFFSGYLFKHSPFHHSNNINNTDTIKSNQYMTLGTGNILDHQKKYCVKLVQELNRYNNLIINIANEPWFDNQEHHGFASPPPQSTKEWIMHVSEWIIDTEKSLPNKHILSVDYMNEGRVIPDDDLKLYYKNISVFNHHYDRNAKSASLNYDRVNGVMSFNETGLMPPMTTQYRIQGWTYIFSGGGLYNNLDFTFQVGFEDGTGSTDYTCEWYSGCTNPEAKYQLAALLRFMNSVQFINMEPDYRAIALNYGDENVYPLVWKGNEYTVYFEGGSRARIKLHVPPGTWEARWINPADLNILSREIVEIEKQVLELLGPVYEEDMLLLVKPYEDE